jgi:phage terminase small subunit
MEAQIQVIKLVNEFGLSPKAVKNLTVIGDNEDDFIEALTK